MEMEKKNIAILVLAVALVASGVGNIIFVAFGEDIWGAEKAGGVLRVSTVGNIDTIDPVDSWDAPSNDLMNQVTEPLFWVDITSQSDPTEPLQLVPCLASGYTYNEDGTELTIDLRQGITFHDGEDFNADAVVYSIERLMYWTNSTGELPATEVKGFPWSLYYFADGTTPLIKSIEKTAEYQVKITLNDPYGPFVPLLSYTSSNIVSPNTPKKALLNYTLNDTLVGTGPFEYGSYETDVKYVLEKNENWWGGMLKNGQQIGGPYFDKVVVVIYGDSVTASNSFLGNEVDYGGVIPELLPQAKADPDIEVTSWGTGMAYYYWGINSKLVQHKQRIALAYAINYTYVVKEIQKDLAVKANTCVPAALGAADVQPLLTDVQRAREIMQEIYPTKAPTSTTDDTAWTDLAANNPLRTLRIVRFYWSDFNQKLNTMLGDNFAEIGVALDEEVIDWSTFLQYSAPGGRDNMDFWYIGWAPDYLSAFNMMNPLFNPSSDSATHQMWLDEEYGDEYNNTVVEWLKAAEVETDTAVREGYYEDIQNALFDGEEGYYPHIPMIYGKLTYMHYDYVEQVSYNSMQNWYWARTYFGAGA